MGRGPWLLLVAFAALADRELVAQERYFRVFDAEDGLNPAAVRSLAQDTTGFLWIGTTGGLFRYDGVEMRRWRPDLLDRTVVGVAVSPRGPVVALREGGGLYAIIADGAQPVLGPGRRPVTEARDVAFDPRGHLWVVRGEEVWTRDTRGGWSRPELSLADGERPKLLRPDPTGTVVLATTRGVWRFGSTASTRRIFEGPEAVDVLVTEDGRVLVLGFLGRLFEVTSGGTREVLHSAGIGPLGRAISVVQRGSTIWISIDRYLVAWRPDGTSEVLGTDSGILSGGPLLVDHEGSLWMGSFTGLYQFPEPETRTWTERDGLPSGHTRYLARAGDTVWVTTWQGAGYVREDSEGWHVGVPDGWFSNGRIHVDSRGVLWTGTGRGLVEIQDGRVVRLHGGGALTLVGFHESPDGETWLGTTRGLFLRDPTDGTVRTVEIPPLQDQDPTVDMVRLDRGGVLWASSGETICRAPAEAVRHGRAVEWRCERIPGAVHLTGLVETASGDLWASTNRLGVLRRGEDGWTPLPGLRDLPSRSVLSLVPAGPEALWIVGHGILLRVTEASGERSGWRVEEWLSHWHGLPANSGTHVLEDRDGGIWVTTSRGVAYIPPRARFTSPRPPRVALVDARVDDERLRLGSDLELPHDRNRLELRFAALSYRDPSLVRYQVRLSEEDPWVTTSREASFRWVDLSPGEYRAQVRASLDGEAWSAAPVGFSFRVAPPWYRRPWAIALFATAIAFVLYAVYRLRVAHLLDLERQRTRIAMDLHDDIGSGLGSIGILSGILATDGVADPERREMVREIAGTAQELGSGLSHIVWTLDPKARTLEELAARLAEHGRRLFADNATSFATRFPPTWPSALPAPPVRQNVLLIGLEALHNAARHAGACNVELGLAPRSDGTWELTVADDGVGLPQNLRGDSEAGMGFRSMRRRAEEIGAKIHWSSRPGSGTTVRLVFRPRGTSWRPGRFLERRGRG